MAVYIHPHLLEGASRQTCLFNMGKWFLNIILYLKTETELALEDCEFKGSIVLHSETCNEGRERKREKEAGRESVIRSKKGVKNEI